jgi:ribonuclease D
METMVTRPEELADCCAQLGQCPRLGFDTEFVGEETYHPRLCLVQVATPDRLFLIDPLSVGPLDRFWELLTDPARLVIVHAGREEVRLCHLWAGRVPANLFDLQIAAGFVGLNYPLGHAGLVRQLLGVTIEKKETLTEWRHRPLTPEQVHYAYDDVRYLLPLWEKLSERVRKLGRETWVREEFGRLSATSTRDEAVVERWRKLRGLGGLDRRRLAIVRAVSQWREETAARLNRPARTVVRDDLIVEIARRNPKAERDLHVIRGLSRREVPALLQVIEEVRALPIDQCPALTEREQDPPQLALVTNVLTAVLGDLCAREHLAQGLAANTSDVKLLARSKLLDRPLPAESPLNRGWRRDFVLPHLQAMLEGRLSLRIADVRAEAPFKVEAATH